MVLKWPWCCCLVDYCVFHFCPWWLHSSNIRLHVVFWQKCCLLCSTLVANDFRLMTFLVQELSTLTKWCPVQALQELSIATQATLEDPKSCMKERKGGTAVEIRRRSLDPWRWGFQENWPVQNKLTADQEGKIFSFVARQLADFLSSNKYTDMSVQKGDPCHWSTEVSRIHWSSDTTHLRSPEEQGMTILWLDLANQCDTIPHKLVRRPWPPPCATPLGSPDPG